VILNIDIAFKLILYKNCKSQINRKADSIPVGLHSLIPELARLIYPYIVVHELLLELQFSSSCSYDSVLIVKALYAVMLQHIRYIALGM